MEHASKQEIKQIPSVQQDHHQPKQLDGIIRMALMHDPLVSTNYITMNICLF